MRNWTLVVLFILFAAPLFGQNESKATRTPILWHAAMPTYPPIAMAAHITGKIVIRVKVKQGLVVRTDLVSASNRFVEFPTILNLKTWRFAPEANGEFTVTYDYEIEGKATENPTNPKVEILPNLDVNIIGRPVKPTVNYSR